MRNKALALGVEDWLASLPDQIAHLERLWQLRVGRAYPDATEALVAPVVLADGTAAVLKLLLPRPSHEAAVLRLAEGQGCVRLLRQEGNALLLERLGPSLYDLKLPLQRRHEILVETARQLWRPAQDLPTGAEKAAWLSEFITTTWHKLDRPCSQRVIDQALRCAESRHRAHHPDRACLVHGDVHQWNTLEARDGFKLVDPDGLLAEPEYDLGIIMREDPLEDDLSTRARWLASRTGLSATAIWEWGVVERVSTGLLGTEIELQPVAGKMLAAAESITDVSDFL